MIKNKKMLWLSANLFGYELLKEAVKISKDNIRAIITLSNKAKTKMYDGVDQKQWREFNIPVYEIEEINKEAELLNSLNPDYIIMAGWRQIINEEILNLPQKGFIGFHPALLPEGRGSAPIINTILLGLKKSGVTMFYLTKRVDDGDIIGQVKFDIRENDYAGDLYHKTIEAGKALTKRFLPLIIKDKAPRIPQERNRAVYFPKRSIEDNGIKINKDSPEEIYRKIRAFSKPYNGAYIKLGNKKLIIWKADFKNEKTK